MGISSKDIATQRIAQVACMMIEAKERATIIQYCSEKWNIGERQADKYIARAREYILAEIKRDVEYDYAKAMKRYESLYRQAIERGDSKLALAVNKEICNIQGLHKIQINHSGDIQFICNIPE